jgi:hypothetical protein
MGSSYAPQTPMVLSARRVDPAKLGLPLGARDMPYVWLVRGQCGYLVANDAGQHHVVAHPCGTMVVPFHLHASAGDALLWRQEEVAGDRFHAASQGGQVVNVFDLLNATHVSQRARQTRKLLASLARIRAVPGCCSCCGSCCGDWVRLTARGGARDV